MHDPLQHQVDPRMTVSPAENLVTGQHWTTTKQSIPVDKDTRHRAISQKNVLQAELISPLNI